MYRFSAHLGRLGVTSHKFSSLARSKVSCNSSFVYNSARCISSSQTGQLKNSQYPGQNNKRNNNLGLALGGGVLALGLALYANKENEVYAKSETEPEAEAAEPVDAEPQEEEPEILLPEIPEEAPYLIIGAGTAAFAAYRAIRARDPKAKVLVIGEETHMPYKRPPLSKELWYSKDRNLADQLRFKQWNGKEVSLFYLDDSSYCRSRDLPLQEDGGIAVVTGKKVVKLDVFAQTAHVDDGSQVKYEKCLIATGGKPKNLPVIEQAGPEVAKRTTIYRNINDFRSLNKITDEAKSIAIIGGGFMGSELACALGKKSQSNGMKIYQIFPESGNMAKVLPKYLTEWTSSKVVEQGITSVPNCYMNGCSFNEESNQVEIATNTGETVSVDHVIVAVGLEPSTEFAIGSDLEVDRRRGGFVVNAELEARTNVWAAGDASCFFDIKLGRRRVEHHDHAVVSGRLAGENMAGAHKPYWHQSMFWSDLGPDIGYEAIGLCDSTLDTVGVFFSASDKDAPAAAEQGSDAGMRTETKTGGDAEAAAKPGLKTVFIHTKDNEIASSTGDGDLSSDLGKGVIFYVRDDAIVGVLTWNIFGKMPIARKAISEEQKQGEIKELAQLFIKPKKK